MLGRPPVTKALKNGFVLSVVGAILLGSVLGWLLFADHGSSSTASRARTGIQISLRRGIYPALGIQLEQPTSWLTSAQGVVLTLASPDAGLTTITISSIGGPGQDVPLRRQINSQIIKTFAPAKVIAQTHGPIGTIPAVTTGILGTKRKILILSTAVSSKYRTYGIQVFFKAIKPTRQSVLEVHNVLNSIRFFVPTPG
ncbi:MAG: hypothetical protein ACR2KV_17205 [Solirubrobacteraceae bacterium]